MVALVAELLGATTVVAVLAALLRLAAHIAIEAQGLSLRLIAATTVTIGYVTQQIVIVSAGGLAVRSAVGSNGRAPLKKLLVDHGFVLALVPLYRRRVRPAAI